MTALHPPALELVGLVTTLRDVTGAPVDAQLETEPSLGIAGAILRVIHALGAQPRAISLRDVDDAIETTIDHDGTTNDTTDAQAFVEAAGGTWHATPSRTRFTLPVR
jgi:hypothetical protein